MNDFLIEHPEDLTTRLERARLHSTGHYDLADTDYSYFLERAPDNVDARCERARLYERILDNANAREVDDEREKLALEDYRHVLEIDPQNQAALEGVERLAPSSALQP